MRLRFSSWIFVLAAALSTAGCAELKQVAQEAAQGIDRVFGTASPQDVEPDPEKAEGLYREGLAARAAGNEAQAFETFREAGRFGHGAAAYEVSRAYTEGRGTARDLEAGAEWTNTAADLGDPRAQFLVGAAYYGGIGVDPDPERAAQFLEAAAVQGHAQAQYLLGEAYSNGRGVPRNAAWAARWYGMAAAQGLGEAQYAYGVAHASGLGLPKDPATGHGWLVLAARNGHEKADEVRRNLAGKLTPEAMKRGAARAAAFGPRPAPRFADRPTVMYVQHTLNGLGLEAGPVDGIAGPRTRDAVGKFQNILGLAKDGRISPDLLNHLLAAQSKSS